MRYFCLAALSLLVFATGCGPRLIPVLATPTPYEQKIPAQCDIAKVRQGKVAVLVQGAPAPEVRQILTTAILGELNDKTDLKKSDLVPASAMDDVRKDEQKYLVMSQKQIGEAVGAGTLVAVKIVNYGLYPLPMGGYYDVSVKVSVTVIDVKTGVLVWPLDGAGREVSLAYEAERGTPESVNVKILTYAAHGVTRYLYDCPKAYFRTPGETRMSEFGD